MWGLLSQAASLFAAVSLGAIGLPAQEAELIVTVVDERTGETVTGLGPGSFVVRDGDIELRVLAAEEYRAPLDVMLLVDASIAGEAVRPMVAPLIDALQDNDSMAVVAYDESAELLQDFTSDKHRLNRAMDRVQYRSVPRVIDAVFAAVDGGFPPSSNRRAVILLSNGVAAGSRVSEAEVYETSRDRQVSVFAAFVRGDSRNLFQRLALRTGGATFPARRLKLDPRQLAHRVLDAVRSPYRLTVTGVSTLGDRIEATINPAHGGGKRSLRAFVLAVH